MLLIPSIIMIINFLMIPELMLKKSGKSNYGMERMG
jgi:hypothetical protein